MVGSQSLVRQGLPLAPRDFDLVYARKQPYLGRLKKYLLSLGAEPRSVDLIGVEWTCITIASADGFFDLGFDLHGLPFDETLAGCVVLDYWGLSIQSASIADMLRIKQADIARRPKDLADIEWMESATG